MTESKHYPKAPIIEAVFALDIVPSDDFDVSLYEIIKQELSHNFRAKHLGEITWEFELGEDAPKVDSRNQKITGIKLESHDGRYIIQAQENSYSFSIINSYDKWEDFSKKAYEYWDVYKEIFKPHKVTRQALRYINRIDIPKSAFELKEYFTVYPNLFEEDGKASMAGFLIQVQIPQKEGGVANITQTVAQPVKAGCISILLDIDVFDHQHYNPDSNDLEERISTLRHQKNFLFRSAITTKTEELIS